MRKLIVLLMTSVLATGAVANADTVNVVKNPVDFIHIDGIYDTSNNKLASGGSIVPNVMDGAFVYGSDKAYTMSAEVLVDGTLEQVAFCFYDSNELTDATQVGNNCDKVSRDGSDALEANFTHTDGDDKPSALTAIYVPGLQGKTGFDTGFPATGEVVPRADRHYLALDDTDTANQTAPPSAVTSQNTLDSVDKGANSVQKIDIKFALSDLAANSSGWKLRVLAEYKDGNGVVSQVVSTSNESYTVSYLGTLTTLARGSVDYGDVIAGNDVTIAPITTGKYRANNTSDINLQADSLFAGPAGTTNPTFGTSASPTGNQMSLACNANAETPVFFDTAEAKPFLFNVPSLLDASTPVVTKTGDIDTDDHECRLYVGDGVEVGTYSNTMTVGVGAAVGG